MPLMGVQIAMARCRAWVSSAARQAVVAISEGRRRTDKRSSEMNVNEVTARRNGSTRETCPDEDRRRDRTGRRATGYERDGLGPLLMGLQGEALTQLRLAADDRFLDVGCATGAAVSAVGDRVHLAVGIDLSRRMIRQACRRTDSSVRTRYAIARADHLPFPAHTFTAVLCTTVLHYLDDPGCAIAEMTRVLRPDGRLVLGVLQLGPLATNGSLRVLPGLTVTRLQQRLTFLGLYVIVLARPTM